MDWGGWDGYLRPDQFLDHPVYACIESLKCMVGHSIMWYHYITTKGAINNNTCSYAVNHRGYKRLQKTALRSPDSDSKKLENSQLCLLKDNIQNTKHTKYLTNECVCPESSMCSALKAHNSSSFSFISFCFEARWASDLDLIFSILQRPRDLAQYLNWEMSERA